MGLVARWATIATGALLYAVVVTLMELFENEVVIQDAWELVNGLEVFVMRVYTEFAGFENNTFGENARIVFLITGGVALILFSICGLVKAIKRDTIRRVVAKESSILLLFLLILAYGGGFIKEIVSWNVVVVVWAFYLLCFLVRWIVCKKEDEDSL
ncbi:MAG: hypothetical protein E7268_08590 [Lachnospiraceae bacterium]|nr:hypothetical protein [Lachnospiraceae bacterium]